MAMFIATMGYFLKAEEGKAGKNKGTDKGVLYAHEAAQVKFEQLRSTGSLKKLTLKDIEPLIIYGWLLNTKQRQEVTQMAENVVGVRVGKRAAPANSEGSDAKASGSKAKKAKTDQVEKETLDLFK